MDENSDAKQVEKLQKTDEPLKKPEGKTWDLSNQGIHSLPDALPWISDLEHINLSGNFLKEVPLCIFKHTRLVSLDLSNNTLSDIPKEIGLLVALRNLNLSKNPVCRLWETLVALPNLEHLSISEMGIKDSELPLGQLEHLSTLDISGNALTAIPPELSACTKLVFLNCSSNAISSIGTGLSRNSALKRLLAADNRITEIDSHLYLPQLEQLNVARNVITSLSETIGNHRFLSHLDLSDNSLDKIPESFSQLLVLEYLDLSRNSLNKIPLCLAALAHLQHLDLSGNDQIGLAPEMLARATDPAPLLFLAKQIQAGAPTRPLGEAKLLVVGQGGVGKSSIVARVVTNEYEKNRSKTDGIAISKWTVPQETSSIRVNVWDFGGQEIMHATHQFFLTKRSIYLLVLDARQGEEEGRLEYWLKIIESFGANSPVIVVVNKIDEHLLELDKRGLKRKYKQIQAFVDVSCKSGDGVEELKAVLSKELASLQHVADLVPERWFDVKRHLESMNENYIALAEFSRICVENRVSEEQDRRTLLRFLHDLGIVLNYGDDPRLEDTNILNPLWVTNGVYRILNSNELFQSKGVLNVGLLRELLDQRVYPVKQHYFIIDMMKKFELCFALEGIDDTSLIPELVSKEEPVIDWPKQHALNFEFHYNILPGSVICRFIVRMHTFVEDRRFWRSGVLLVLNDCRALVRADSEERRVYISVMGEHLLFRRHALAAIRAEFDHIHKTIAKIVALEKVPIPETSLLVDYRHLLALESQKIETFIPEGTTMAFRVSHLLDGIEDISLRGQRASPSLGTARESLASSPNERTESQVWNAGGFFLASFVTVVATLSIASHHISALALVAVFAASIIASLTIGALVLRHQERLTDTSFIQIVRLVLERLTAIRVTAVPTKASAKGLLGQRRDKVMEKH